MWQHKSGGNGDKREEGNGLLAVAIDKDKGSQHALKWAIDHLLKKGQAILLLHVKLKSSSSGSATPGGNRSSSNVVTLKGHQIDQQTKDLLLPFRCFCTRKDVQCHDVVLEDNDIAKALIEYVSHAAIETLVLGAPAKNGLFRRFKTSDVPSSVYKGAPDFCTVYIINKNKISQVRSASRPAPSSSPLRTQMQSQASSVRSEPGAEPHLMHNNNNTTSTRSFEMPPSEPRHSTGEMDFIKSPFTRGGRMMTDKSFSSDLPMSDTDISFVSSGRPSMDRLFPSLYDNLDSGRTSRVSNSSDMDLRSFESIQSAIKSPDLSYTNDYSYASQDSADSYISQNMEDVEAEMRRLKLELKQTMDMYSTACKEALTAKQKATELHRWKMEEEQRLEEARMGEEVALSMAEREKSKAKAALEAAEAAKRIAELESQKRRDAEMRALKESQEKTTVLNTLAHSDIRYRKYPIDEIEVATEYFAEARKIGEGGYGPVYKGYLDHTQVAIKVLRPDAAQGRSQFQQEIEVLSCIRHPNMVLLLGACPEYGCLVYEYMANGSLDDRLFRRGNTPVLSWQLRFRIAAEIGAGLLFLHQTKPEPIVHRDLKPGNILLDRNFVSKISDVGLARLVPASVADTVTQYHMTSAAGTFCYIDPEYQQTGMLGIKSDVYSLGIMFLQIITAKSPMGLAHHVEHAIEKGTFSEMLDPTVTDWPVEDALGFAKLSLKCAELRRRDRPDLGKEVMKELNRLRTLAEENMPTTPYGSIGGSPNYSRAWMGQDVMSDPQLGRSGDSSKSRSSGSSLPDRRSYT